MTTTYWDVGRRIVEYEQGGEARAEYGIVLLKRLSKDLLPVFGRGFGWRNIYQIRLFYQAYPDILQTASAESGGVSTACFPLPWSCYVRLITVDNPDARAFYEAEALRRGWKVRQLDRQIAMLFYERTALSRNKARC